MTAALRVKKLNDALVDANRRLAAAGAHRRPHRASPTAATARTSSSARSRSPSATASRWRSRAIDVDHFKEVNDTHGHQGGDEVLAEVARRLARAIRGGDELARWGGDEFVVIRPPPTRRAPLRAAERLRAAVADEPIGRASR